MRVLSSIHSILEKKKLVLFFDFICQNVIFASVGDLHGDLSQTRSALEMAGVLSSNGEDLWIGGDTVCYIPD